MSAIDLDAARKTAREAQERADKATPGPWDNVRVGMTGDGSPLSFEAQVCNAEGVGAFIVTHDGSEEGLDNTAFVAAARTDVPDLAAIVLAMAEELTSWRSGGRETDGGECPNCHRDMHPDSRRG